jgi:hypothetical protein
VRLMKAIIVIVLAVMLVSTNLRKEVTHAR